MSQYPKTTHTFIQREVAALEARGLIVERWALRRPGPSDGISSAEEEARTRYVLDRPRLALLATACLRAARSPAAFLRAIRMALRMGWRSERGVVLHLVYLLEACTIAAWMQESRADHLHSHFAENSAAVALLAKCLTGRGYSFTAHGPDDFDAPVGRSLQLKIEQADLVIAISSFAKSQLCRWSRYLHWNKIHVVRCGLDRELLEQPAAAVPKAPRFASVGRLSEQKGQMVLLEAVSRLRSEGRHVQVDLVGDGPLRAALETQIEALDLRGVVTLHGRLDNRAALDVVRSSRALVMPSFAEGLPVTIMEAMALARPIISTRIAGTPELVDESVGWLVPAGDAAELASAMWRCATMPACDLDALGHQGRERVARLHDVQTEAGRLAELFEGAVAEGLA